MNFSTLDPTIGSNTLAVLAEWSLVNSDVNGLFNTSLELSSLTPLSISSLSPLSKYLVSWFKIQHLCNRIWKTKRWPADWKNSTFLTLPKKRWCQRMQKQQNNCIKGGGGLGFSAPDFKVNLLNVPKYWPVCIIYTIL